MNGFGAGQFTRVKDLSDKRRLPRLGKIRLGVKGISKQSHKEYPIETPYFVVPPEIARVYGDKPTELEIMIPVNSLDVCFPTRLIWFGLSKGIKCIGDGERAMRIEEPDGTRYKEMIERECPCELLDNKNPKLKCSKRASLFVMVPKASVGGIFQIDLSSYNSIVDIQSGLEYVQALVGRFAMVPLLLKRVPRQTHYEGKTATHYTLQVFLDASDINFINSLRESTGRILAGPKYALPAPEITNPAMDEGATVVEIEDEQGMDDSENGTSLPPQPPPPPPEKKSPPSSLQSTTTTVVDVKAKSGETNGRVWTRYTIKTPDAEYTTFSKSESEKAQDFMTGKKKVLITYTETDRGRNLAVIEEVGASESLEPPPDDTAQDTGFPTEEEAAEALKERGMVPGEETKGKSLKAQVDELKTKSAVMLFFSNYRKEHPGEDYAELTQLVNAKLDTLKK